MRGNLKTLAIAVPLLILAVIFGLIATQSPQDSFSDAETSRMDFSLLTEADFSAMPRVTNFTARDSTLLPYRLYRGTSQSRRKIYMLHDAGWHGMALHRLATSLAYSGVGDIIIPDLRGHGASPARRGAVEYAGQLSDDLADLIMETSGDGDEIVIVGYSFGGGLAIRFAAAEHSYIKARYILLSPFLGFSSPVNRSDPDPWLHPLSRRIAGLSMFEAVGLHFGGDLVTLQLAFPKAFLRDPLAYTVTPNLTWNTLLSLDPEGVLDDGLSAMGSDILVIGGGEDELFDSRQYKSVISKYSDNAKYEVIDGANHINLVNSPEILTIIQNWLSQ